MTGNMFGVAVKGVELTNANIKTILKIIGSRKDAEALKIAVSATIEYEAERTAPLKTGAYKRSVRTYPGQQGDRIVAVMSSDMIYAPTIERGSKPHKIEPKTGTGVLGPMQLSAASTLGGQSLYRLNKSGKLTAKASKRTQTFRAFVNHPGTKGMHIFENAVNTKKEETMRVYGENLNKMIKAAVKQ